MSGYAKVQAAHVPNTHRVYWDGSNGPIDEGAILAYVENATIDATNAEESRGSLVERPTAQSIPFLAGAVQGGQSLDSAGYVDVIKPEIGVPFKAKVNGAVDVGDLLDVQPDQYYLAEIDPTSYSDDLMDFPVFVALEANTSGTNVRLVMLKKG